jgi:hypothetical protein
MMPDRSEVLRREAARCREAAERTTDPNARDELIRRADKFLELARSATADFDPLLEALTGMMKETSELVVQQQQWGPRLYRLHHDQRHRSPPKYSLL